jgi:hypothetical protein
MEFEWLPTECADERAPMQLIGGRLHCDDDVMVPVPAGKIVNNGWGEVGSLRIIGEPRKPVPHRLSVVWFSFTEDRFFGGGLELPRAELTQLFVGGFEEPLTRTRATWSNIIVGMGVGGWVNVWLAGSGLVHEVAGGRLEPTEREWSEVIDNPAIERAAFVRAKLAARLSKAEVERLAKQGPRPATFPRFPWRIAVSGVQVPLHMFVRTFNGERRFYDFARRPPGLHESVPKQLQITWLTRAGRKLLSDIQFDEAEVFRAIEQVSAAWPSTQPTLHVELRPRSRVSLVLENHKTEVPLVRARVEVSSLA